QARAIIERIAPQLAVYLSCDVAPILGEYERSATVALTAYLGPRVLAYARDLETRLRAMGYPRNLLFSHCLGGLTTLREVALKPLLTLDSGPAGGVLGASFFSRIYGKAQVICSHMGGTSFDVSVITNGEPTLDEEPVLEKYTFLIPKIAISTIGAGGGSIVWLDKDGLLRVGPQSSGSMPGPAAYGRGGERATVTDVDLILGYLNPDNFLGGRMKLDVARARDALRPIADALGMSLEDTAAGAFKIVNAHMADLIRQATIEQGHDPRNFVLFCYGGAGPAHSPFLARELGIGEIYVPSQATVFSALGMLTGGLVHSLDTSFPADLPLSDSQRIALKDHYASLEQELRDQFVAEGIDESGVAFQRILHMKYRLQPNGMGVVLNDAVAR
ncbi:MAG: hydantoinase/oxoprolinase family protein, partial [Proteobacteria bacterium]|nr:hydantoinase/oxoprolinase family protein [Pseudomonadota bacterium]